MNDDSLIDAILLHDSMVLNRGITQQDVRNLGNVFRARDEGMYTTGYGKELAFCPPRRYGATSAMRAWEAEIQRRMIEQMRMSCDTTVKLHGSSFDRIIYDELAAGRTATGRMVSTQPSFQTLPKEKTVSTEETIKSLETQLAAQRAIKAVQDELKAQQAEREARAEALDKSAALYRAGTAALADAAALARGTLQSVPQRLDYLYYRKQLNLLLKPLGFKVQPVGDGSKATLVML